MKTITKNYQVFNFDELSDAAKEKATNIIADRYTFDWNSEYESSMETFSDILGVNIHNWSVGAFAPYFFKFYVNNDNVQEISDPVRLATWINNNIIPQINKGKYFSTHGKWIDGKYIYKKRYSKVLPGDYMPTGFCADCNIFGAILDCATYKKAFNNISELISACLDEFFCAWRADMEYCYTPEYAAEEANANGIEFLADGSIFVE